MWQIFGDPPFILPPRHAAVFRGAASYLSSDVGWEDWQHDNCWTDDTVFDRLTQGQKQVALLQVSRALLDPQTAPPRVTAVLAATMDAVYKTLLMLIELEIEQDESTEVRELVLQAMDELNYWEDVNDGLEPGEEPVVRPSPNCADNDFWDMLVESLETDILEDFDFDMDAHFGDLDPAQAAVKKRLMNIHPDYFTDVPEDPPPQELEKVRHALKALIG